MWNFIIPAVATVVGAIGQSEATKAQGREAVRRGNIEQYEGFLDEELRAREATQIRAQSIAEASNIKRQALSMRGALMSAQAGSGTVIGEGSAQAAVDQIDTLASADVLATLYTGVNRSVSTRQQGRMSGEAGRNAARSGAIAGQTLGAAAQWQLIGGLAQAAGQAAPAFGKSSTTKKA